VTIPDKAVEAALNARLTFKSQRGMDNAANLMRHILEAAAPHLDPDEAEDVALFDAAMAEEGENVPYGTFPNTPTGTLDNSREHL
jgi:hypothetical protein